MKPGDTLQVVAQATVVLTLALALVQTRAIARQTNEVARQTKSVAAALQQGAYLASLQHQTELRISFLRDDPRMLRWHLATRGYKTSSRNWNRRILYAIVKFDIHEMNWVRIFGSDWLVGAVQEGMTPPR
jgi:hypothetical protein